MEPNENITMVTVCDVQFRTGTKIYYFDPGDLTIETDEYVIIDTARGPEFGKCVHGNHQVPKNEVVAPLRPVIRLATAQDKKTNEENRGREKHAHKVCLQKIADLGLEMQLVSTEYAFDGSKILFFFTADGRVDFRELVKNLASILRTRIELRQIGVRDKAKMIGGLGICGRPFCCTQFLTDFHPVSVRMAKTQNLSLNPAKISGTCGRLMCCLNYEQEAYEDLLRTSPKADSFVDTPDGRGTVTDVNLLRQCVHVRLEKQPDTIVCHNIADIFVLRNGKAKKNDPPIPEDLAPISGVKRKKKQEKPTFSTYLEPVVMRRSAEELEPAVTSENAGGTDAKPKHRRRRNNTPRKPSGSSTESRPKPQQKKPAEPRHDKPAEARKHPHPEPKKPAELKSHPEPKKPADGQKPAEPHEGEPRRQKNNYRRYHKRHKKNPEA